MLGLGGHELEKELSPIMAASKPTGQNKTIFQQRLIGSSDMLVKL
jgi:hypothetical protein